MIKYEEYKGKAIFAIYKDESDKYPFRFGVPKAKMILENIKEIERFVRDHQDEVE